MEAAVEMRAVEELTDAEIAEAHQSAKGFAGVEALTEPLDRFLSLIHAFGWLAIRSKPDRAALRAFFDGQFGDPIEIAVECADVSTERPEGARFGELLQGSPAPRYRRALPQLAGSVPRRLDKLAECRARGRLRCRYRQSALGPDEAATG